MTYLKLPGEFTPATGSECEQRARVVREALSWKLTPFVHGQCVKGLAADCSTFAAAVFKACGIFDARIPRVPSQWFMHRAEQFRGLYVNELSRHAIEYTLEQHEPQPGDMLVALSCGEWAHGTIVLAWPRVIHCFSPCVQDSDVTVNPTFVGRPMRFFDPWSAMKWK